MNARLRLRVAMPTEVEIVLAVTKEVGAKPFLHWLMSERRDVFSQDQLRDFLVETLEMPSDSEQESSSPSREKARRMVKLLIKLGLAAELEPFRGTISTKYSFDAQRWADCAEADHKYNLGNRRRPRRKADDDS